MLSPLPRAAARPALLAAGLAVAAFTACGDSAEPGAGGASQTTTTTTSSGPSGEGLPCDVAALVARDCLECHGSPPRYGAVMPLVTRDDFLAAPRGSAAGTHATVGAAALERLRDGTMPPPPGTPWGETDIAVLASWVDAGMPLGEDTCTTGSGGGGGGLPELDCEPDISLIPTTAYEMAQSTEDDYVCFGVQAPSDVARHITAIAPRIDNQTIVHHILLLQTPEPVAAQGTSCGFVNAEWKLIYAWGPGTGPLVLPSEAGFPIGPDEPGNFVLQIHYSNLSGLAGESDRSGVDLCTTTELRPHDADIMAFGGVNFSPIPVNTEATLACETAVPGSVAAFMPLTIFQAWPHMHQIGRRFESVLESGGQTTTLADVPNYDFEYQIAYPVNATLDVGDSIRTTCTWQNNTSSPVGFGEDTNDEMCFNFVGYYPRITAPNWHWLTPSAIASCEWQ